MNSRSAGISRAASKAAWFACSFAILTTLVPVAVAPGRVQAAVAYGEQPPHAFPATEFTQP
jgi:hypothetical protein